MSLLTFKTNIDAKVLEVCFSDNSFSQLETCLVEHRLSLFDYLKEKSILCSAVDLKSITQEKSIKTIYSKDYLYQIDFIPGSIFTENSDVLLVNVSKYDKSSLYLKNIIDNLPYAVFWKDNHSVFLGCNTAFAKAAGKTSSEDVIGKTDHAMAWKKHANKFIEIDKQIIQTGKPCINFEEKNLNSTVLVSKVPIFDNHDKIIGVLGIYTDITDKKRAEQLEQEKEIAQKNADIMNTLSSSVAHEIRTPLSIIKINADLMQMSNLLKSMPENEEKEQFINRMNNISQAIKECSQVMDMLLVKLRKIASVNSETESWETCSILETIQTTLSEYPFRTQERALVHFKEKPNNNFLYRGHSRLTKHVLFNLLKNALYVIRKAEKGEVFIEYKKQKNYNQLIFKDTSLGIEENYVEKIFNKFETSDETNSGTGLGLAFCKLVMDSYGGKIECYSKMGEFTQFTLSFPVM